MLPHPDRRSSALASRVRMLVAPVLRECPPECGIVAITDIDVTTDQTFATITISALKHPEAALAYLKRRHRDLQKLLSKLGTKFTPQLRLRLDKDGDRASRLDALLDGLPAPSEAGSMSTGLDIHPSDDSSPSKQDHQD